MINAIVVFVAWVLFYNVCLILGDLPIFTGAKNRNFQTRFKNGGLTISQREGIWRIKKIVFIDYCYSVPPPNTVGVR